MITDGIEQIIITDHSILGGLRQEWNELVASRLGNLYMTFEWVTSLWESHLGMRDTEFVILKAASQLQGIFPLTRQVVRKMHMPFCQYGLVTNNYGQNHNDLILFHHQSACMDSLLNYLREKRWDIFFVGSVPSDSKTILLLRELEGYYNYRLIKEPYVSSPFLTLNGTWETFIERKSGNFRSDLQRKWNKTKHNRTEFKIYSQPGDVDHILEEICKIESNSWKEDSKTSITTQPIAKKFYNIFLPKAAENGWLYVVIFYIDGKPAAYDMGILFANKYYMLKTSYDLEFKQWSPGTILRQFVIQELYKMNVGEHDFLGSDDAYKMRWTDTVRKHWNIYLYNKNRPVSAFYSFIREHRGRIRGWPDNKS